MGIDCKLVCFVFEVLDEIKYWILFWKYEGVFFGDEEFFLVCVLVWVFCNFDERNICYFECFKCFLCCG